MGSEPDPAAAVVVTPRWVGRRLPRLEDPYLLTGRATFVDDEQVRGGLHVAFVRSTSGAARLAGVDVAPALVLPGVVAAFTAADLGPAALRAVLERPEFVVTDMPVLAVDRVRHVGEPIAVVVATSPYSAEDGAEAVVVDYEDEEAVASIGDALRPGAPRVQEAAAGNVLLDVTLSFGDAVDATFAAADHVVEVEVSTGRLSALPLEGRACAATYDERTGQIVLHSSTQVPHLVRTGVAQALGLDESRIRVVVPDVGGGFGQKAVVAREEVVLAQVARALRRPVKWTEDRREGLIAGFQAREQALRVKGAFDADGTLRAIDADVVCDIGAYNCFPFSCGVEVLMAANELPGPYRLGQYRVRSRGIATNKAPMAPYRGVSRPQVVLAMERLMDVAARQVGIGPVEIRDRNLVRTEDFPYRNVVGVSYDAGSYRESLQRCAAALGYDRRAEAKTEAAERGRRVGIGFGCFVEPTAYGTASFGARKMTIVPGYEQATVRMDASGSVTVLVGTLSHGQGHATTFAQIVADRLGVHPSRIRVVQGDTDLVPHGWGSFASRSVVTAGGALTRAADVLADQLRRIAGHLLEVDGQDVELVDGEARVKGSPTKGVAIDEAARVAHHRSDMLPPQLGRGLEVIERFDPSGTFSNATHGALVEVDPETGAVVIKRYVVVEDCGVMINPMLIDGQVSGGVVQGIGSALLEELVYDPAGQPVSASLVDYLVPTATDVPVLEIHHLETPTERTTTGAKGMGEGGAIGAPAAIVNAVNDALAGLGAVTRTPIRPADVVAALGGWQGNHADAAPKDDTEEEDR